MPEPVSKSVSDTLARLGEQLTGRSEVVQDTIDGLTRDGQSHTTLTDVQAALDIVEERIKRIRGAMTEDGQELIQAAAAAAASTASP